MGPSVRRASVAALCLMLSGCGAPGDLSFPSIDTGKDAAPGAGAESRRQGAVATPVEPLDPERLVGLDRAQVTALIGPPVAVKDSAPATVWTYRIDGCSLEVMFYMDLETRAFRVLTYEVHPAGSDGPVAASECVGRIRAARYER